MILSECILCWKLKSFVESIISVLQEGPRIAAPGPRKLELLWFLVGNLGSPLAPGRGYLDLAGTLIKQCLLLIERNDHGIVNS